MKNMISFIFEIIDDNRKLIFQKNVEYPLPILPIGSRFHGGTLSSEFSGKIDSYTWSEKTENSDGQLEVVIKGPALKKQDVEFVKAKLESNSYKCWYI